MTSASGAAGQERPGLEALEEERDFCLRSLRDLEAERAAGDLDDADYDTLRDSYVARAAAALRELDRENAPVEPGSNGRASPAGEPESGTPVSAPPMRKGANGGVRKRVLVAAGVVVVGAAAAWAVVASSATRLPGEEVTGQAVGSVALAQSLQAAQQAVDRGDALTAVKDYQKVLKGDPKQPQALAGEGWILAQTQQPALLQQGLQMLTAAEQADPAYGPAHVYRGIALLSEADYRGAIPELQWYLDHDPDPQLAPRVRTALQQAKTAAAKGG
jgi:hypothetical protein